MRHITIGLSNKHSNLIFTTPTLVMERLDESEPSAKQCPCELFVSKPNLHVFVPKLKQVLSTDASGW